jgi:peptidoglycan/xylan/chitin deacetylase (PgdA/CDA1 family)
MSGLRDLTRNAAYRSLSVLARGRPAHLILLYHSVGGGSASSVPADAFAAQMALVAERFTVVPLSELRHARSNGGRDQNLACITFDDGYRDNYEHALPILERHGLRASFFPATSFLGGRFRSWAADHPMMTAEQVRTLATLGHEIGAHSVTHRKLTQLPADAVRRETADSKSLLEDLTGRPVHAFAYPKGAYDDAVQRAVADAGFAVAVTIREGVLADAPDWLALPRVGVHDGLGLKAFAAKLSMAAQWYHRLRGAGVSR